MHSAVLPWQFVWPSVHLSVHPSVCDYEVSWSYRLEFLEIIQQLISLIFSLSAECRPPTSQIFSKGNTPNFSRNLGMGYRKFGSGHTKLAISPKQLKTEQQLLLTAYIKWYTSFRLLPECMTLNDLWARFKVIDSLNAKKWRNTG